MRRVKSKDGINRPCGFCGFGRVRRAAFSLVELIVVIAIVSVLLGFVVGGGSQARTRARVGQARSEIAAMHVGLEAYRTDLGFFPSDAAGASINADAVRQLTGLDGSGEKITDLPIDWNGPYMHIDRSRIDPASGAFLDPWQRPYHVLGIGDDAGTTEADLNNKYTFDIWSDGPDRTDQSGAESSDDITNF